MQHNEVVSPADPIVVGRFGGAYGIKGWVKVISHTRPEDAIFGYSPWYVKHADGWRLIEVEDARQQGKGMIARLSGVEDRDQALLMRNQEILIESSQMPQLPEGEYYWSDLTGLEVVTDQGVSLGKVDSLVETGANDVLVIKGDKERLVPFIREQVVRSVDLERGVITVDWDPEF